MSDGVWLMPRGEFRKECWPSFARFTVWADHPIAESIDDQIEPNVPGATTSRAMRSASMTVALSFNMAATVVLPHATCETD